MPTPRLLFIDDDKQILLINKKYFSEEGYDVKVASTVSEGLKLIRACKPDCIILDIMLPNTNGFQACQTFKSITNAPCIFLSGLSSENDKVKGLLLGAEDYIVKPYSLKELNARIKVQLRRYHEYNSNPLILSFPPLRLNVATHKAFYNEEEIALSNREYDLLHLFMSNPNRTLTFQEIGQAVWNQYAESDRHTVLVLACRLRKKLEQYIGLENIIETVWSQGYCFHYN